MYLFNVNNQLSPFSFITYIQPRAYLTVHPTQSMFNRAKKWDDPVKLTDPICIKLTFPSPATIDKLNQTRCYSEYGNVWIGSVLLSLILHLFITFWGVSQHNITRTNSFYTQHCHITSKLYHQGSSCATMTIWLNSIYAMLDLLFPCRKLNAQALISLLQGMILWCNFWVYQCLYKPYKYSLRSFHNPASNHKILEAVLNFLNIYNFIDYITQTYIHVKHKFHCHKLFVN